MSNHETFLLQRVQPFLLGLSDGTISTLAPLYTLSFLVDNPFTVFVAVMSVTLGAAVSMGVSEGLSDDGSVTGRGDPARRGLVTGIGTLIGGGLHALPFLIPDMITAVVIASIIVAIELVAIAYIRYRYFEDTSVTTSLIQVTGSGAVVVIIGILLGYS